MSTSKTIVTGTEERTSPEGPGSLRLDTTKRTSTRKSLRTLGGKNVGEKPITTRFVKEKRRETQLDNRGGDITTKGLKVKIGLEGFEV